MKSECIEAEKRSPLRKRIRIHDKLRRIYPTVIEKFGGINPFREIRYRTKVA
jgi:hypothetical protein